MNKIGWDEELGQAMDGNKLYPSIETLIEADPGVDAIYGIVEVEVRLKRIVKESDFSIKPEKKYRVHNLATNEWQEVTGEEFLAR